MTLLIVLALMAPIRAAAGLVTFENTTLFEVADGSFGVSTINVSGLTGTLTKVVAEFEIYDTNTLSDYDIKLRAPDLNEVMLISDLGHFGGFCCATFIVDDDAPGPFPSVLTDPAGTSFLGQPTDIDPSFDSDPPLIGGAGTLSRYIGTNPNGTWLLIVIDDLDQPSGDFNSRFRNFRLHLTVADSVPEPSSLILLPLGVALLVIYRRRRCCYTLLKTAWYRIAPDARSRCPFP